MIAEKPSVARELADLVGANKKEKGFISGNGYYISWCFGHLVELAQPDQYGEQYKKWDIETLPIIPETWKLNIIEKSKDQYYVLKKLMEAPDVEEIICAGDCGREGELIFRLVYEKASCKKPVKRLWVSSMEAKELKRGLAELCDNHKYDGLYQAALCRLRADWLIGMNFSRLYTVIYDHPLHIGRVQTPAVGLLVKRQKEIENFSPEPYWLITADLGGWRATATVNKNEEAKKMVAACNHKPAYITKLTREDKKSFPPALYSTTELQKEANQLFSYTAQQTLTYMQTLYEKKLITYPRTECRYLPSDMLDILPERMGAILSLPCMESVGVSFDQSSVQFARIINDEKQTDHHAIIPTGEPDDNLPGAEKNILRLVAYRFLTAVSPAQEYQQTTVILDIEGFPFKAAGKAITAAGYQVVVDAMIQQIKDRPERKEKQETETCNIPADLQEGQTIKEDISVFSTEKKTSPPKPYTEDALLSAMANISTTIADPKLKAAIKDLGLGTGATRAGIIENIVKSGYVVREGRKMLPTKDGIALIEITNGQLEPELTAEWEDKLEKIAEGKLSSDEFMNEITQFVRSFVDSTKLFEKRPDYFEPNKPKREVIGVCPRCGQDVVEYPKSFSCVSGKGGCGFAMWKNDRFFASKKTELSKKAAAALLKSGKAKMKGLFSEKTGKTYDATVLLKDTGTYVNFGMEFDTPKKSNSKK